MHPSPNTSAPLVSLLPRLRARARRLTRSPGDAEDLLQDTVLKLLQALARGDEVNALDRYSMITLRNQARQNWRDHRPLDPLDEDMALTFPDAPLRLACAELEAAIDQLPEDQRSLIRLVAAGNTSPAELACATGLPLGTVMSRLARARARLRNDLGLSKTDPVTALY